MRARREERTPMKKSLRTWFVPLAALTLVACGNPASSSSSPITEDSSSIVSTSEIVSEDLTSIPSVESLESPSTDSQSSESTVSSEVEVIDYGALATQVLNDLLAQYATLSSDGIAEEASLVTSKIVRTEKGTDVSFTVAYAVAAEASDYLMVSEAGDALLVAPDHDDHVFENALTVEVYHETEKLASGSISVKVVGDPRINMAEIYSSPAGSIRQVTGKVTKLYGSSFFLGAGDYAVEVFSKNNLGVAVGDTVSVKGTVDVFNGLYELKDVTVTPLSDISMEDPSVLAIGPDSTFTLENDANKQNRLCRIDSAYVVSVDVDKYANMTVDVLLDGKDGSNHLTIYNDSHYVPQDEQATWGIDPNDKTHDSSIVGEGDTVSVDGVLSWHKSGAQVISAKASNVIHEGSADDITLRFVAASDIHSGNQGVEIDRLKAGVEAVKTYAASSTYPSVDAFLAPGDISNNAKEEELTAVKNALQETLPAETSFFPITGNHEFFSKTTVATQEELWNSVFGKELNTHEVVNGYHFINLSFSAEDSYNDNLDWLTAELSAASVASPAQPIFVQQHYPKAGTVVGSHGGELAGMEAVDQILANYPNVVDINGHSHMTLDYPNSIYQDGYTSIACGSMSYLMDEADAVKSDEGQMVMIEVTRDSRVIVTPYSSTRGFLAPKTIGVMNPSDYVYTPAYFEQASAPTFATDAALSVGEVNNGQVTVSFPQADDASYLSHYVIRVKLGEEVKQTRKISDGKFAATRPTTLTQVVEGLAPSSEYEIEVVAVNFAGKESAPLTVTLVTPEETKTYNPDQELMVNGDLSFENPGHGWNLNGAEIVDDGTGNKVIKSVGGGQEIRNYTVSLEAGIGYIFSFKVKVESVGAGFSIQPYWASYTHTNGNLGHWAAAHSAISEVTDGWVTYTCELNALSENQIGLDEVRFGFIVYGSGVAYFDDLSVHYNLNIFFNGDLEDHGNGYAYNNVATRSDEDAYSGSYSIKFAAGYDGYFWKYHEAADGVCEEGKTYRISMYAKLSSESMDAPFTLNIYLKGGPIGVTDWSIASATDNGSGEWRRLEGTFTPTATGQFDEVGFQNKGGAGVAFIDCIRIEATV